MILLDTIQPALLLHAQIPSDAGTTRAEFVEWFVGCALFVVGSSLLLRPRAWRQRRRRRRHRRCCYR